MKQEDIRTEIVEQLHTTCPHCGINDDIIDKESFSCFEKSESYVAYQARLEGTSERDSDFLMSLMEEWVGRGGGVKVIVTGVRMTIDPECSGAISTLRQPECSPLNTELSQEPHTDPSVATASGLSPALAITAGVVVIVLIVSIAVVVIILVIAPLALKHRRKKVSFKNLDKKGDGGGGGEGK